MTERRGGLGRGIAALIPSAPPAGADGATLGGATSGLRGGPAYGGSQPEPSVSRETESEAQGSVAGAVYKEIAIASINPNPKQPRQVFDEEALNELEHSIREFGLMQPIVVREIEDDQYELIMGERRWRASQLAGLEYIPAIVRETKDDALLRDALLENIHRVQLNPLEEAAAYQQLLDEFGVTHDELADRIGRSRPVITNTIRLLRLPLEVQRRVAVGVLSAGHARALLSLEDVGHQEDLAKRIVAEGLSVRATEEQVTLKKSEAPAKEKSSAKKQIQAPGFDRLADRLANHFDTKVKVARGSRKGKIVIEYGSVDDLERIAELILGQEARGISEE
ncbi:ParB/RepB/Spo0J family partition protein [Saccharopolyspora terrae]|uniref:ParB/RepB/Spo0J family partition protein n=1 Tax=Saccharopolyspora terrae TaxID=2530384 RepID=A0A4R4VL57_9PSEU|nr:ParB/RepB/Spo0J family partition protein [Saccharopolyspora terrae]TDD02915.1 ParB/RepB/Spo0J family partition protein [Saccharopolyspora terrae]